MLAIDPGPERSAWVRMEAGVLVGFGIDDNPTLLRILEGQHHGCLTVIEMIASYGMPVGAEVFNTCVWIGRFIEGARRNTELMYRREVKMQLCGVASARDSNIRQRLIDIYGPGKPAAIGLKKTPGPLYGVKKDIWAALGVAVTWCQLNHVELFTGPSVAPVISVVSSR